MAEINQTDGDQVQPTRRRMSCGIEINCPSDIRQCLMDTAAAGYHFIVSHIVHPNFGRNLISKNSPTIISRTDRLLNSNDWNRLVVGKLTPVNVDSEIEHVVAKGKAILIQELGFASHLGLPAVMLTLTNGGNVNLARILYNKLVGGSHYQIWVHVPMVHSSRYSPICKSDQQDTWEWWNELRTYCHFDKRLGIALELPDVKHLPTSKELDRWVGEPVRVLFISTQLFLINQHQQVVLSRAHQDIIQRFMSLDVQYVITGPPPSNFADYKSYFLYMHFLGKKLYVNDTVAEFVKGCEDYLQNPLQPLSENLETMVYEVFEKDQVKYVEYQKAIQAALEDLPPQIELPVVMVVGAGRGPLVQAALNASILVKKKIKLYAIEKNPYAINTLMDRVKWEWKEQVILVNEDMRTYDAPEKADIIVSELLGSFGDNELSPECLDGAQRFLKDNGVSIPQSYTSYLAPLHSTKLYNEIRTNCPHDKSFECAYETPYVVHLVNYYQISQSQEVYRFEHPNKSEFIDNERYQKLRFRASQNCVLTGFIGFFEAVLYKDITLSINPQTFSTGMVSWFPIMFSLKEPVQVKDGDIIELCFWRLQSDDKVWYQWCLQAPVQTPMCNPNGRSFNIKKH